MKRVLLNEAAFNSRTSISKKNPNTVEFITVLQECGKSNRNGRIYPREVLEQAINSPYVQERLRTNSFYGEAGHPSDTSVQRQMTIDLRNVAFLIKEMWWEGDLLKGRCETADTAIGRDMKGLIEMGSQVAFSLRAQGNVHNDPVSGKVVVESPLNIACYDWVQNPSHDKAFLEKICESTMVSMFRTNDRNNMVALCESENIFNEGLMINLDEEQEATVIDYTKGYHTNFKRLSEMYIPSENDEVLSINEEVSIKSGDVVKKVVLEDFLVKDIRSKIMALTEEKECPTVDKNPDDANADLTNEKLYDKEMEPTDSEDIRDTEGLDNKDIMSEPKDDVAGISIKEGLFGNIFKKKNNSENNNDVKKKEFYVAQIDKPKYNNAAEFIAAKNAEKNKQQPEEQAAKPSQETPSQKAPRKRLEVTDEMRKLYRGKTVDKDGNALTQEQIDKKIRATYSSTRSQQARKDSNGVARNYKSKWDQFKEALDILIASGLDITNKEVFIEAMISYFNCDILNEDTEYESISCNDIEEMFSVFKLKEASDYELMCWLNENGYEPTKENVTVLKEGYISKLIAMKNSGEIKELTNDDINRAVKQENKRMEQEKEDK